jgi:hypothetical protein
MTRIIAVTILALAVSGCASGQDFLTTLKSHVGPPLSTDAENVARAKTQTQAQAEGKTQPDAKAKAAVAAPPGFGFCANCLVDRSGRVVAASSTVAGDLERVAVDGDMLVFVGWAADTNGNVPAKAVVFVSNGAPVAQVTPDRPRPDVSGALKSPRQIDFGFEVRVPKAALGQSTTFWIVGADDKAAALNKMFQQ